MRKSELQDGLTPFLDTAVNLTHPLRCSTIQQGIWDDGTQVNGDKDDGDENDSNKDNGNKDDGNKDDGDKDNSDEDDGDEEDGNEDDGDGVGQRSWQGWTAATGEWQWQQQEAMLISIFMIFTEFDFSW